MGARRNEQPILLRRERTTAAANVDAASLSACTPPKP